MEVIVDDTQLSLAIGKKGQNVRLAAKLLGWKIDIKSEEEKRQEVEAADGAGGAGRTGIGSPRSRAGGRRCREPDRRRESGPSRGSDRMTPEQIEEIQGIGPQTSRAHPGQAVNAYYAPFETAQAEGAGTCARMRPGRSYAAPSSPKPSRRPKAMERMKSSSRTAPAVSSETGGGDRRGGHHSSGSGGGTRRLEACQPGPATLETNRRRRPEIPASPQWNTIRRIDRENRGR